MLALIVEPCERDAIIDAKSLAPLGIETAWMPNAEAAIQYCREHVIDILICHVILDDLGGCEVLAEIIKDQPIPALMISRYPVDLIRSVRGFDRDVPLLLEPFTPDELAARIAGQMKKR